MPKSKSFCLKCLQVNLCKCDSENRGKHSFSFSHKLRPPTKKNNVKWREFLIDCPQFVNCLPEELYQEFNGFLKDIKFKEESINGYSVPFVFKGSSRKRHR